MFNINKYLPTSRLLLIHFQAELACFIKLVEEGGIFVPTRFRLSVSLSKYKNHNDNIHRYENISSSFVHFYWRFPRLQQFLASVNCLHYLATKLANFQNVLPLQIICLFSNTFLGFVDELHHIFSAIGKMCTSGLYMKTVVHFFFQKKLKKNVNCLLLKSSTEQWFFKSSWNFGTN